MRKKIVFPRLFLYLFFFLSSLFLYHIGNHGEPFSIALAYAVMGAGFSLPYAFAIGVFPSLLSGNFLLILLYVEVFLLCQILALIQM